MIFFPNCKINLGLHILSRREDGYHNIETVMIPVPLKDVLELIPSTAGETRLFTSGNKVDCPAEKNLVMKAYRAVKGIFPTLPPTDIYLRKIIPDGAGLGGGSSDASFTITGLNKLYNLRMPDKMMEEIAAGIGADCPFFIKNRSALATGTGTDLKPIDSPLKPGTVIMLAKPDESVSTKEAYEGITPDCSRPSIMDAITEPVTEWKDRIINDFEKTVGRQIPEILEFKRFFLEHGAAYAAMSGSGSAVYGIFPEYDGNIPENVILENIIKLRI